MSPHRSVPEKPKEGGLPSWFMIGAVAIVAIVVVIVGADFVAKTQTPTAAPAVSGVASSGRTAGNPSASVAMMEFSDFQ